MGKKIKYYGGRKENINKYDLSWPRIPCHPYRIFMIRGSETNALLNLLKQQDDDHDDDDGYSIIDKTYLYVKDSNKTKHQNLIKNVKIIFFKIWKTQRFYRLFK